MVQATSWSHEVLLPASALSAGKARAFVAYWLAEHRLLYLVNDVRLVASELATNAVVHAKTDFTVSIEGHERSVRLTVSDASPATPTPSRQPVDELRPGGRGLLIVSTMSHGWGVLKHEGAEKSVWATFELRRARELDQNG